MPGPITTRLAAAGLAVGIALGLFTGPARALPGRMQDPDFEKRAAMRRTPVLELNAADVLMGKRIFKERCARCHGENGDGKGPEAERLEPRPRDLRHNEFKLRSTPMGELPTDADIIRTISRGIPGTAMVGVPLSSDEMTAVIAYIKSMHRPGLPSRFVWEKVAPAETIPRAPKLTWARAQRGRQLFRLFGCWRCHGLEGKGDGPLSRRLKDRIGRRTLPADLTERPFKTGDTPEDVFRLLITGMNYTPMPGWPVRRMGVLPAYEDHRDLPFTPEQVAEIKAYIKSQPFIGAGWQDKERQIKYGTERLWDIVAFVYSLRAKESARLVGRRPRTASQAPKAPPPTAPKDTPTASQAVPSP